VTLIITGFRFFKNKSAIILWYFNTGVLISP